MSRPRKAVVDYFPHYVAHRKSMFIIEQRFGNNGYSFWFKLLEFLGDTENHYLNINETDTFEYLLAKTRVSESEAKEILNLLVRVHSIDADLFEKGIIYSQNFIDNLDVVYSRRGVDVYTKEYLMELMSTKTPLSGINVDINPQSKGKESIVKESKRKEKVIYGGVPPTPSSSKINIDFANILDAFHVKCAKMPRVTLLNQSRKNTIKARISEAGEHNVMKMIENAGLSEFLNGKNERNWIANFDWLFKPANFAKVLEGNYFNNKKENEKIRPNDPRASASEGFDEQL